MHMSSAHALSSGFDCRRTLVAPLSTRRSSFSILHECREVLAPCSESRLVYAFLPSPNHLFLVRSSTDAAWPNFAGK